MTDDAISGEALGEVLDRLYQTIEARKGGDPKTSYTAKLLAEGPLKCAKKMGEEAVEVALAAVGEDEKALASEAADLLYHLLVVMAVRRVTPREVAKALIAREGVSGHDEKRARAQN